MAGCGDTKPGTGDAPPANENQPPAVDIELNVTQGATPFQPKYSFWCNDPDNNLEYCELRIDGQAYARGADQKSLFPEGYERPSFYWDAISAVGNHTIEIFAMDKNGLNASKAVKFTVLAGAPLTKSGWYVCNSKPDNEPCTTMLESYCGRFDETDLAVRQAAAQAISKHPGAFSVNQLLDIYDWVHSNVFYHNVPLDMYPPYYPNQTLATKSGDCKNQAVLIASMVQAIGGSARVLLVPDCHHAFAEVYMGTDINTSVISSAIGSHYDTNGKGVTYHRSRNANNQTDYWFIFDTAGGSFPGETIPGCLNASQTFEIRDCSRPLDALRAAETQGTAYGPYVKIDETKVLDPEWGWNYWLEPSSISPSGYKWCHFNLSVQSLSPTPFDWYLTDEAGYQNSQAHKSFSYFEGGEQVMKAEHEFDWDTPQKFYVILKNRNSQNSITTKTTLVETCYKG
ncbi:MAG: transglutaminase-like domain-containing protein [Candidatus Micrarchaeia archaeon]